MPTNIGKTVMFVAFFAIDSEYGNLPVWAEARTFAEAGQYFQSWRDRYKGTATVSEHPIWIERDPYDPNWIYQSKGVIKMLSVGSTLKRL